MSASAGQRRTPPVLRWSVVGHGLAAAVVAVRPGLWPWVVGAAVADHAMIVASGLLPRCRLLGPNLSRLPAGGSEVVLTFDDGPDPDVTPRVLDLLDGAGARATFFPIGDRAAAHPELIREISDRGHGLGNHTRRHPAGFAFFPPSALRREVGAAQELLTELSGRPPRWFRAPAGIRSPWLEPVLSDLGLRLVSWTRRGYDSVSGDAGVVSGRLLARIRARDILLLHDGGSAPAPDGTPVVLPALERVLAELDRRRLRSVPLPD